MNTLACTDPCPSLLRMKGPFGPTLPPNARETTSRAPFQREPCSDPPFPTARQELYRRPAAPPRGRALSLHALDRPSPEQVVRGCEPHPPRHGSMLPAGLPASSFLNLKSHWNREGCFTPEQILGGGSGGGGGLFQGCFPAGPPPPQILYTAVTHLRSR